MGEERKLVTVLFADLVGSTQLAGDTDLERVRALGAARGDDGMLARAEELFAAFGLEWHRAQTERLLAGAPQ